MRTRRWLGGAVCVGRSHARTHARQHGSFEYDNIPRVCVSAFQLRYYTRTCALGNEMRTVVAVVVVVVFVNYSDAQSCAVCVCIVCLSCFVRFVFCERDARYGAIWTEGQSRRRVHQNQTAQPYCNLLLIGFGVHTHSSTTGGRRNMALDAHDASAFCAAGRMQNRLWVFVRVAIECRTYMHSIVRVYTFLFTSLSWVSA